MTPLCHQVCSFCSFCISPTSFPLPSIHRWTQSTINKRHLKYFFGPQKLTFISPEGSDGKRFGAGKCSLNALWTCRCNVTLAKHTWNLILIFALRKQDFLLDKAYRNTHHPWIYPAHISNMCSFNYRVTTDLWIHFKKSVVSLLQLCCASQMLTSGAEGTFLLFRTLERRRQTKYVRRSCSFLPFFSALPLLLYPLSRSSHYSSLVPDKVSSC